MLEYRVVKSSEVCACVCDRCGLRMVPSDIEWGGKLSLSWRGGFGSVFGDGVLVSVDLCERCVRDALGQWLRCESVDGGGVDGPRAGDAAQESE